MEKRDQFKISLCNWDNGVRGNEFSTVNGLHHGLSKWWHKNGSMDDIKIWRQDLKHGIEIIFKYE